MTFLPILERELRVRARSRANYWGRVAVGTVGVLVCVPPLLWSSAFASPAMTGRGAFHSLVSAAFLLCCGACLLTADTISGERREGTLGLLLLTRVRYFDVLLGKFASSGLACLLALVAFLPVLALPLLAGGVTGGEAARKAAALLDTLFLALGAGLWASSRGFERFQTAWTAILVLAGLVLGPGLVGLLAPGTHAWLASPLGTVTQAGEAAYKTSAAYYWLSLGLVNAVGWGFVLAALESIHKRLTNGEEAAGETGHSTLYRTGNEADLPAAAANDPSAKAGLQPAPIKCRYCGRRNEPEAIHCSECGTELWLKPQRDPGMTIASQPSPLHWLLRRQRGLKPMLWLAAVIGALHLGLNMAGRFWGRGFATMFLGVSWAFSLVTTAITSSLIAWVASRFFVEARRTGELELLLTTPVGAAEIASTQWDVLKRMVTGPLVLMLAPLCFQGLMLYLLGYGGPSLWRLYYPFSLMFSAVNTVLSVGVLCWLGFWFGLRVANEGRAILWTVLLANGPPYALSLFWSIVYRAFVAASGRALFASPWMLGSLMPQLVTLLLYLWMIHLARRQLLTELAGEEPWSPRQLFGNALPRVANVIRRARRWPAV